MAMEVTAQQQRLQVLHEEIDNCHCCAKTIPGVVKIIGIRRGELGKLMIVGQGPGRSEAARKTAFAGQSGTRLDSWLRECGADPANPRAGIYLTSITKCVPAAKDKLAKMIANCRPLLWKQIDVVQPALVITLGSLAYEQLQVHGVSYPKALCQAFSTSDIELIPRFGLQFVLLPWPHPSGLNRWLNVPENLGRLRGSFEIVRRYR